MHACRHAGRHHPCATLTLNVQGGSAHKQQHDPRKGRKIRTQWVQGILLMLASTYMQAGEAHPQQPWRQNLLLAAGPASELQEAGDRHTHVQKGH